MEAPVKTKISSRTLQKELDETEKTAASTLVEDTGTPDLTEGHDSFSTDDSFNSLDSVIVHDVNRAQESKHEDPILNAGQGRLHFRNRASFTAFASSVGLLNTEQDEQEVRGQLSYV